MSPVFAVFAVVAAVLVVSGAFKLRDPAPTEPALRVLHVPSSRAAARAYGLIEVVVGLGAIVIGGPVAGVAVALLFALFAGIVIRLMTLGDAAPSCGCFGRLSSKPSAVHAGTNVVAAVVAVGAALFDRPGLAVATEADVAAGEVVAAYLFIALATSLVVALLTVLPDTLDATRRRPRPAAVRTFEISEGAL